MSWSCLSVYSELKLDCFDQVIHVNKVTAQISRSCIVGVSLGWLLGGQELLNSLDLVNRNSSL